MRFLDYRNMKKIWFFWSSKKWTFKYSIEKRRRIKTTTHFIVNYQFWMQYECLNIINKFLWLNCVWQWIWSVIFYSVCFYLCKTERHASILYSICPESIQHTRLEAHFKKIYIRFLTNFFFFDSFHSISFSNSNRTLGWIQLNNTFAVVF